MLHPAWAWKLLILGFFVLLTNPVSSHALARAAHSIHTPEAAVTVVDQLEDSETRDSGDRRSGERA